MKPKLFKTKRIIEEVAPPKPKLFKKSSKNFNILLKQLEINQDRAS